jgi:hypothetical protein
MDAAQTQRERNKSSVRVEQLEKQCLCHCPAQRARQGRAGEPTVSIAAQPSEHMRSRPATSPSIGMLTTVGAAGPHD